MRIGKGALFGIIILIAAVCIFGTIVGVGMLKPQSQSTVQVPISGGGAQGTGGVLELGPTATPSIIFTIVDAVSNVATGSEYTITLHEATKLAAGDWAPAVSATTTSGTATFTNLNGNTEYVAYITNSAVQFTSYPVKISGLPELTTKLTGPKSLTIKLKSAYRERTAQTSFWTVNTYANGSTTAITSTAALALGANDSFQFNNNVTFPGATADKNQFGDSLNPVACFVNFDGASISQSDLSMSLNGVPATPITSIPTGYLAYASNTSTATTARQNWTGFVLPVKAFKASAGYQVLTLSGKASSTAPIDQNIYIQCADSGLLRNSNTGVWEVVYRDPVTSTTDFGSADMNLTEYTS